MKIKHLLSEAKKGVVAPKYTVKPRNLVAKNAASTTSGAGAHKDKKKAAKQGDVKHKGKEIAMQNEGINLSEQYVGNGSSKNMQMAVDIARMNAKRAALEKIHGPNYTDVTMPDHEFGKVDLQSDGKGGYRASIPLTIKQAPQSNYLDASPATSNTAPPNNYMDKQPAKSDGKQTGTMEPMESSRNPDLMSQTDYDRYQQNQMDSERRNFKRDEMEQELGHEERGMYYVVIAKNGKWEHTKAQPRQEGMNAAQRVINSLHTKYPSMHLGMMGPDGKVYNMGKGK